MRYDFDGQKEGEEIVALFRRHKSTTRSGKVFLTVAVLLGVAIMKLWPEDNRTFWVFLALCGVGALGCLYVYTLWYFSFYIVTNQRFRQVIQKSIFKKAVLDLPIGKIESVAYVTPGIKASVLKYGTLIIKTTAGDMKISKIANIEKIYNKIQKIIGENDAF